VNGSGRGASAESELVGGGKMVLLTRASARVWVTGLGRRDPLPWRRRRERHRWGPGGTEDRGGGERTEEDDAIDTGRWVNLHPETVPTGRYTQPSKSSLLVAADELTQ
jgi:hypothetical protein